MEDIRSVAIEATVQEVRVRVHEHNLITLIDGGTLRWSASGVSGGAKDLSRITHWCCHVAIREQAYRRCEHPAGARKLFCDLHLRTHLTPELREAVRLMPRLVDPRQALRVRRQVLDLLRGRAFAAARATSEKVDKALSTADKGLPPISQAEARATKLQLELLRAAVSWHPDAPLLRNLVPLGAHETSESPYGPSCPVCMERRQPFFVLGGCGHGLCGACACACKAAECPVCRATSDWARRLYA